MDTLRIGVPATRPCEPVAEGLHLVVVERDGRADRDRDPAVAPVPDRPGLGDDRPEQPQTAVAIEHAEEAEDQLGGPAVEHLD